MSKTKEQILHSKTIQMTPFYHDIKAAMDEYASQVLSEYKEKLKKNINNFSKDKHGRIFTHEVIELIDNKHVL
jgi:hypothetical protein